MEMKKLERKKERWTHGFINEGVREGGRESNKCVKERHLWEGQSERECVCGREEGGVAHAHTHTHAHTLKESDWFFLYTM